MVNGTHLKKFTIFDEGFFYNLASTKFIMPEKVNGNKFSGKSNTASLNSGNTSIAPKSAVLLNSSEHKLATLQKMADNSPYSQRFAQLKSLANKTTPSHQPVSQLSKDSHSLPDNVKQGVESLSGISMDDVKVHYNSAKPAQLNAHAYAQGTDIHIASGQEKHLPHEAWHVVQQKQGRVRPTTMMKAKVPINDDAGLEKEADVMGARALQIKPFSLSDHKTGKAVQRKKIIQRAPFAFTEGEEPKIPVSELIKNFEPKNTEPENTEPENTEPEIAEPEINENEGFPGNDFKGKNPMLEKAKKDDTFKAFKKAGEKYEEKENAKRIAEEAEEARLREEAEEAEKEAKKLLKEAEEAKAAADAGADATRLQAAIAKAVAKAVAANEIARQKWKLVNLFNERRINLSDLAGTYGRVRDVKAEQLRSEGSVHAENYAETAGQGAAVGSLVDLFELFGSYGKWQESGKTGFDHAKLALTLGKFITGFTDTVNTTLKYAKDSDDYMPEALTQSISLLPGIKAGLGAFKNAVEFAENYKQGNDLDKILSLESTPGGTGPIFNDEEIKILKAYRSHITIKQIEIGVDALFNAAQVITMIDPTTQAAIAITHTGLNVLKSGFKSYVNYVANQERKRSERIGDVEIDALKEQGMEEKSGREGYPAALKIYLAIKVLKNEDPPNAIKIDAKEIELEAKLDALNKDKTDVKLKITRGNFDLFLECEKEAIYNIAEEVEEDKTFTQKFYRTFHIPKKDEIIKEMAPVIDRNKLMLKGITLEDIYNLQPDHQDYFFNKTQIAIRTASNRKHISSKERLDMMEEILLTKADDSEIKKFMIDKYKDKDVYDTAADSEEIKFKKSVKKFKLEMKLD